MCWGEGRGGGEPGLEEAGWVPAPRATAGGPDGDKATRPPTALPAARPGARGGVSTESHSLGIAPCARPQGVTLAQERRAKREYKCFP